MRALVLGGTRFIGLHLVRKLVAKGHQVTLLNRGRTQAQLPQEVERLYADRLDAAAVQAALRGRDFDVAFDLSAYTTLALVPAVRALEGRVGRYVFCSTVSVYARPDTYPISETQGLVSGSPPEVEQYPLDKVACEEYLAGRGRRGALSYTILRPCVVYGPHNHHVEWEFSFMARLRQGRPVLVPGDGSRIMHFVFVEDVAEAFTRVPETGASIGQAYNIAGPEAITLVGYLKLLARIVGVEPQVVFVPDEPTLPSSFPRIWPHNVIFSIERAQSHLGFRPRPLYEGMSESYSWYLAQRLDDRRWEFSAEDRVLQRLRS